MKTKFYLTLVLILFTFIFLSNCGSNDVTQVTSYNPTSNDNMAYITIHVKWPSEEKVGNYMISSGSEDAITASLTKDTHRIELKIYDNLDINKPLEKRDLLGEGTIKIPVSTLIVPVKVKALLPTIPVTLHVETFQGIDTNTPTDPIFSYDKDADIKVGYKHIYMSLGDFALQLFAEPSVISLVNSTIPSSAIAEPTPVTTPEAVSYITARLMVTSPDMTPSPYPTYFPKEDTITAQETNLTNRKIDFTIEEGGGILNPIDNQETNGRTVTAYTDSAGYCTIKFTTTEAGITKIRGVFQPDPNDPNSIYTHTCNIYVSRGQSLDYNLTLSPERELIIIPDFSSPDFDLIKDTPVKVKFSRITPEDPNLPPVTLNGKVVDFTVISGQGALNRSSAVTDPNGECEFILTGVKGNADGYIKIKGEVTLEPDTTPIVAECQIYIHNNGVWWDDFDLYPAESLVDVFELSHHWYTHYWQMDGEAYYNRSKNYIDASTYGNSPPQSARLYGDYEDGQVRKAIFSRNMEYNHPYPLELRFNITNGTEALTESDPNNPKRIRGCIAFSGVNRPEDPWYLPLLIFKNNENLIKNSNDENLGNYTNLAWNSVRIQYIPIAPSQAKINYYIYNSSGTLSVLNSIIVDNLYISTTPNFKLILMSMGGSVWYDDIRIYHFGGLTRKTSPSFKK